MKSDVIKIKNHLLSSFDLLFLRLFFGSTKTTEFYHKTCLILNNLLLIKLKLFKVHAKDSFLASSKLLSKNFQLFI